MWKSENTTIKKLIYRDGVERACESKVHKRYFPDDSVVIVTRVPQIIPTEISTKLLEFRLTEVRKSDLANSEISDEKK